MAFANLHPISPPAGANVHLIKIQNKLCHQKLITIKPSPAAFYTFKLALSQIFPLLYHFLAQYAASSSLQHLCLAIYVLFYLSGTVNKCLCYDSANGSGLHGYSNSSLYDQTDNYYMCTCS